MSAHTNITLDQTRLMQLHEIASLHGTDMNVMVESWIIQEWQRLGLDRAAQREQALEPILAIAPTDLRW